MSSSWFRLLLFTVNLGVLSTYATGPAFGANRNILDKIKSVRNQDTKNTTPYVFSKVFGISEKDSLHLCLAIGEIFSLVEVVYSQINSLDIADDEKEVYLKWYNGFNDGLVKLSVSSGVDPILSKYTAEVRHGLEFCAIVLEKRYSDPIFNQSDIDDIYKQSSELFEKVMASETIAKDLKEFIIAELDAIINAINSFKFSGTANFQKVFEQAFGAVRLRYKHNIDEMNKIHEFHQLMEILWSIGTMVTTATGYYALGESLQKMIAG